MDSNDESAKLLGNYPSAPSSYQDPPPYEQTYMPQAPPPPPHVPIFQPNYQAIPLIQTQVILVGGCPACRVGVLEDDYTCLGICCAIFCFPLGVLCCLATKQRRCANCGAIYG